MLLSHQWRKSQLNTEVKERIFALPRECKPFQAYHDNVQQDLQSISGMDEFLAGIQHILIIIMSLISTDLRVNAHVPQCHCKSSMH